MRKKFHWNVTLQSETGEIVERKVSAYWDPEAPDAAEAIMRAGRVEAWMASGKQIQFAPISATRIEDTEALAA